MTVLSVPLTWTRVPVQGVLDPLNNAKARADALEANIERASAVCFDAGHCPHDECPEFVNEAIADFVDSLAEQKAVAAPVV